MKKMGRYILEVFPLLGLIYRTVRDHQRSQVKRMKKTPYGFLMAGQIEHESIFENKFEALELSVVGTLMSDTDVFIDVGANVGLFTMLAKKSGKEVIAFEPLDKNLHFLYRNLYQNGFTDIEVYPIALSRKPGVSIIYGASMMASLIENWGQATKSARQIVPLSSLDIILGDRFDKKSVLVKIDVEGHEYDVLLGAEKLLTKNARVSWLIEIGLGQHHPDNENVNFSKTFDLFFQRDYFVYAVGEVIKPLLREDVERLSSVRGRVEQINYLFTKKELCQSLINKFNSKVVN